MLQTSDRFKKDIKKYSDAIERVENDQDKVVAKKLLNDLIYEVKNMDNMFMDMVYTRQLPAMGQEIKSKIVDIRKQLNSKLKLKDSE